MKKMLPYSDDYEYPLYLLRSVKNFVERGVASVTTINPVRNRRLAQHASYMGIVGGSIFGAVAGISFMFDVPGRMPVFISFFAAAVLITMIGACADPLTERYQWRVRRINKIIRDYNRCDGAPEIREVLARELSLLEQRMINDLSGGAMSKSQCSVMKYRRAYERTITKYKKKGLVNVRSH